MAAREVQNGSSRWYGRAVPEHGFLMGAGVYGTPISSGLSGIP